MVSAVKTNETKKAVVGKNSAVKKNDIVSSKILSEKGNGVGRISNEDKARLLDEMNKKIPFENLSSADKFKIDVLDGTIEKDSLRGKIRKFSISNDIVHDKVIVPMVAEDVYRDFGTGYNPYRLVFVTAKDFLVYGAKENLRNQEFGDTAKSVYESVITNPCDFHSCTSPLVVRCDKMCIKNGKCWFEGNVVMVDGATRALLFEEMRRDARGAFDEILEKIIIPVSVQIRSDFYDNIDLQLNSANRNTSTPVDHYNIAQGAGVFEELYKYAGRFTNLLDTKSSKANKTVVNGKYVCKRFNDDLVSLSPYFSHSSINEKNNDYGAKTTLSSISKKVVQMLRSGEKEAGKNYFNHMKSVVEDCYSISEYADFYFLHRVAKLQPEYLKYLVSKSADESGIVQPNLKSDEYSLDGKNIQRVYNWNKTARRGLLIVLRNLYKEENGEISFICDPIKLFNDDMFIMSITQALVGYMTITLNSKEKKDKGTSVDVRENDNAKALYNMGGSIIRNTLKGLMVK